MKNAYKFVLLKSNLLECFKNSRFSFLFFLTFFNLAIMLFLLNQDTRKMIFSQFALSPEQYYKSNTERGASKHEFL